MKVTFYILLFVAVSVTEGNAQWTRTNGPFGAEIISFYSSGDSVYAGTASNGLFESTNSGKSWHVIRDSIGAFRTVNSIYKSGNNIFIGTNGGGVQLTTDGGQTWNARNNGIQFSTILGVLRHNSTLFCMGVSINSMYRSEDGGTTWSNVVGIDSSGQFSCIKSLGSALYTAVSKLGHGYIYRSLNNGYTWENASLGLACESVYDLLFHNGIYYAATNNGIYRTSDSAIGWEKVSPAHTWALANVDNTIYAADSLGIHRSHDNGTTWNSTEYKEYAKTIVSDGNRLFVGFLDVHVSTDMGYSWVYCSEGMDELVVYNLFTFENKVLASTQNDVYMSEDHGDTWVRTRGVTDKRAGSIAMLKSDLFLSTHYPAKVYRSRDSGRTWIKTSFSAGTRSVAIGDLEVHNNDLYVGTVLSGLFVLRTKTNTWKFVNDKFDYFQIMDILSTNHGLFVACSDDGVYRSNDDGETWTNSSSGLGDRATTRLVEFNSKLFVGTTYGMFVSTNNGDSWSPVEGVLGEQYIHAFKVSGQLLFARSNGIYVSSNNGESWKEVSEGLVLEELIGSLSSDDKYIYVGGVKSAWRRPLSDFTASEVDDDVASVVFSIFPNPTDGIVNLNLGNAAANTVCVVNVFGEVVVENHWLDEQSMKINLSGSPAGVYFVRLGDNTMTHTQMVVLR